MKNKINWLLALPLVALVMAGLSCGNNATLFNPAFINQRSGTYYPRTPGPGADFVLVRTVNETNDVVTFDVTIERRDYVLDDEGNPQTDSDGNPITKDFLETRRLTTFPVGKAREMGTLFPCNVSPVIRVGLGQNLLPTDSAVFVGGTGINGDLGFGVPATGINPLDLFAGNFNCGDTIIFRAITSTGVTGNVVIESFLLPGSEQPSQFQGANTFVNLQAFLESQVSEDSGP